MAHHDQAKMIDVVVLGQTPPPVHGQSVMIERLVRGHFKRVRLHHVRMAFSGTIADIGVPSVRKVLHLAATVARVADRRARTGATVLYYPPAGPDRVPMRRDFALLSAVRPLFRHTVFHFHAGGVGDLRPSLGPLERRLFDHAYGHPDVAIRLAAENPEDGRAMGAMHDLVIPYGMEDNAGPDQRELRRASDPPTVLFVGMVAEEKGVDVLLDACSLLKARSTPFAVELMGAFRSADYERHVRRRVEQRGLGSQVRFLGPQTGDDKWQAFRRASMLCFPTHYRGETFGLVVLEAMQFSLPVIATRWRGVPSLVRDGETGLLVPTHDAQALAIALDRLLRDPGMRETMGQRARAEYQAHYSVETFWRRMEDAFLLAATG